MALFSLPFHSFYTVLKGIYTAAALAVIVTVIKGIYTTAEVIFAVILEMYGYTAIKEMFTVLAVISATVPDIFPAVAVTSFPSSLYTHKNCQRIYI